MKKTLLFLSLTALYISVIHAQSYGEYTLYSLKNSTKAYLVDLNGNTYKMWTFNSSKPVGYSSYLLPGGIILRTVAKSGNYFTGGPICGEVQKVDWNGNVIWDYVYSTTEYCTHHDICPMPNGNVLLIAYESKNPTQVSAAGCSQNITMWPDKIVEIEPVGASGGNVVWEWHAWDHLSQSLYPSKANYVTSIVEHPELLNINYKAQKDWLHVNGIDYNEQLDQVVFSSHNMNEFYVIDHSTTTAEAASHSGGNSGKGGDILYRWGNPEAYQASGTANFNVVHDAHWVPAGCPNAGYLCGFNNKGGTGGKTCVDLVSPPLEGYNYQHTPGTAYTPSTYSWRHTYNGTPTQNEGNSQQLPNGNTLVNISFSGYIYEIDPNQNVVWSKTVAGTNTSAFRYTNCYVNSIGYADATALPKNLCEGESTQLNALGIGGSDYTYLWSSNPAGFSSTQQNPIVTPSFTTTYIVTITSGNCTATDSVKVVVTPFPSKPSIAIHADSLISSSQSNNQWYLEGALIPGATEWYYLPTEAGNYQVQVTENGCASEISAAVLYTSVNEPAASASPEMIYLNDNGIIRFEGLSTRKGNFVLQLYNYTGLLVIKKENVNEANVNHLPSGIYLVRLFQKNKSIFTGKIFIHN